MAHRKIHTKQEMKETTSIPDELLDLLQVSIERSEFWLDVLVNSQSLSENDEIAISNRKFISSMKRQLLTQGRTVQTLRKIELINGRAVFPEQIEPNIPPRAKEAWGKTNQLESEMLKLFIKSK